VTADNFHNPYSREFVVSFFGNKMSSDDANFWYDLIDNHIKCHAPCEVKTNFHFFWWYNFCFKWQNVYFRMLNVIPENQHSIINENFLRNNYHHFFNSASFQKWSMLNHHLKIGDSWNDYKLEAKNVIYDYTKNIEYKKHKIKMNSLYRLWSQRRLVLGITDDYKMLYDVNPADFYQRDNDFV
jgi:hypothetical protein